MCYEFEWHKRESALLEKLRNGKQEALRLAKAATQKLAPQKLTGTRRESRQESPQEAEAV